MSITMTALKFHTHAGEPHDEGTEYEVEPEAVDNLVAQGMAKRTHPEPPPEPKPSEPIEPMGLADFGRA